MNLRCIDHWEYDESTGSYRDFIQKYNLVGTYYNGFKDQLSEWVGKKITKKNMFNALNVAKYKRFYNPYDLLEKLAEQYIKENDLFDQVFFIEDSEGLYTVTFYEVVPTNQADLKRFFAKHLDAYKNGFGEIVEEVIERRSRNTPK